MKIVASNNPDQQIKAMDDWEKAFTKKDSMTHWKEGRSAHSLAKYFIEPTVENSNGIQKLKSLLSFIGYDDVDFISAEIEHESRFDDFRNGRMQDLFVKTRSNGKYIPICIEAKVDEAFGDTMKTRHKAAETAVEKNPNSQQLKRIENLLERYYALGESKDKKQIPSELLNLRYQLIHALAGSLAEAKDGDVVLIPILVFHTDSYNEKTGEKNKKDYHAFMESLKFEKQVSGSLPNCEVYVQNIENVKVWSFYVDVDFRD
jgi:hypothetical protein